MRPIGGRESSTFLLGGIAIDLWQTPVWAGRGGLLLSDENWEQAGFVINHSVVV